MLGINCFFAQKHHASDFFVKINVKLWGENKKLMQISDLVESKFKYA